MVNGLDFLPPPWLTRGRSETARRPPRLFTIRLVDDREAMFRRLIDEAQGDDDIVGVFVFGSRARGSLVDEASDYDVGVVVRDEASLVRFDERWPYVHGSPVEVVSATLEGLREHASVGTESEWARPQYAHVRVCVDKTRGELQRVLDEKERIPDHVRGGVVRSALGEYVNATYRSLRNRGVGATRAARLDAAASIGPLLTAVFALHGRVRPFNKQLEWELEHHPLSGPAWSSDTLLPRLDRVLDGDASAQRELFRAVEAVARAESFGAEIDGWEPDLDWLRGTGAYRAPDRA
jgi:predicted nucleotidyltransferase